MSLLLQGKQLLPAARVSKYYCKSCGARGSERLCSSCRQSEACLGELLQGEQLLRLVQLHAEPLLAAVVLRCQHESLQAIGYHCSRIDNHTQFSEAEQSSRVSSCCASCSRMFRFSWALACSVVSLKACIRSMCQCSTESGHSISRQVRE